MEGGSIVPGRCGVGKQTIDCGLRIADWTEGFRRSTLKEMLQDIW